MRAVYRDRPFVGATRASRIAGGVRLTETEYQTSGAIAPHAHSTTLYTLVLRGRMNERSGHRSVVAEPGTLVVHPRDEPHAHRFPEPGARFFVVQMGGPWMGRLGELGVTEPASPMDVRQSRAGWLARRLHREFPSLDTASQLSIEGLALTMLGELAPARFPAERSANPRWLRDAVDMLHSEYEAPVDIAEVAEAVGVHPVHLARTFREHYGVSMGEYLRHLRLERARDQLLSPSTPLADVARGAGFPDREHFDRLFQRRTGLSPDAYRRAAGVPTDAARV